jgi:hypothetical protein
MDMRQRMENVVSIDEIVHTCSNEKVAQAALASLGLAFATRVRGEADCQGISAGAYVARLVSEFDNAADASERRCIHKAMERADQPILAGLRLMIESRLNAEDAKGRWPVGKLSCLPPNIALRQAG